MQVSQRQSGQKALNEPPQIKFKSKFYHGSSFNNFARTSKTLTVVKFQHMLIIVAIKEGQKGVGEREKERKTKPRVMSLYQLGNTGSIVYLPVFQATHIMYS